MKGKILLLLEEQFRDEEVIYPYYRLAEEGYEVITVGPEKGREYKGKFGFPLKADVSPKEVNMDEVLGIIIPGGYAPDKMRANKDMVEIVKKASEDCKVISAICHGGWMLAEADIIKDKQVTGYIAIATDLSNAGGKYIDKEVVADGNIVTSRKPADLPAFCKATIELLKAYNK